MVMVALMDPLKPYLSLISPATRHTQGDIKPTFDVATTSLKMMRALASLVLVSACVTTLFAIVGEPIHCNVHPNENMDK